MIKITTSCNQEFSFVGKSITGFFLLNSLNGKVDKKNIVAFKVDDVCYDLRDSITSSCHLTFISVFDKEGLQIMRHDCAHLLAQALLKLYPGIKIAIGPTTENGFYYDVDYEDKISEKEFSLIEKEMFKIVLECNGVTRQCLSKQEAISFFQKQKQDYKVEILKSISDNVSISVYKQGDFVDLCKGPHGVSLKHLKYFKLTNISGAYWRGDEKNKMLQRIYGTCWPSKKELFSYITLLKEFNQRDHRKIGIELDLFHFQNEAKGIPFWHAKGSVIFNILENYIRKKHLSNGYVEVKTPLLCSKSLWEQSGHVDKFAENMFFIKNDDDLLALKPMNCPCHIEIFKQGIKSYKQLPLRMFEFGVCHRNEPSGSLHGLMRVKSFTQDDAHIFCSEENIADETLNFFNLLRDMYSQFGFREIEVKFSTRPKVRAGDEYLWDKAEKSLKNVLEKTKVDFSICKGEGAFYGPKLEFQLKDAINRTWQCGTLQLDFILPKKLNALYIDKDGIKQNPIILHRAVLGSLERFIGILIEHYKGKLPLWLNPIQVGIATVVSSCIPYADKVNFKLINANIRSVLSKENNTISYKIREFIKRKVPIIITIGEKEVEKNTITVRENNINKEYYVDKFINYMQKYNI